MTSAPAKTRSRSPQRAPVISLHDEIRAAKRDIVLERAARLFAQYGYHRTSMDTIADSVQVTKPLIYSLFASKTDLLVGIYQRVVTQSIEALEQADTPGRTPTEVLEDFARRSALLTMRQKFILAVFVQEVSSIPEEQLAAIDAEKRAFNQRLVGLIKLGVRRGEFNVPDANIAALAISGMIGRTYVWHREDGALSEEQIADMLAGFVLRLVGAAPPQAAARGARKG